MVRIVLEVVGEEIAGLTEWLNTRLPFFLRISISHALLMRPT